MADCPEFEAIRFETASQYPGAGIWHCNKCKTQLPTPLMESVTECQKCFKARMELRTKTWSELWTEWLAAERWCNETGDGAEINRAEQRQLDIEYEMDRRRTGVHKIGTDGMHQNKFCTRCYQDNDNLSADCKDVNATE